MVKLVNIGKIFNGDRTSRLIFRHSLAVMVSRQCPLPKKAILMADVLSIQQRKLCMSHIRGANTGPEIKLRKALWSAGLRYRLKLNIPGKPDIAFPGPKIAIFVDGCFWHKCNEHYQIPKSNHIFWTIKINKNVERDKRVNMELEKTGWTVIRLWEHDVNKNLKLCINIIRNKISKSTFEVL